jgi:hypothetical protein
MTFGSAILGGVAGAAALTLIHETVRRVDEDAPRMDLLGMDALSKSLEAVDADVPKKATLFKITMAGDIISNSLYYSLAGIGDEKTAPLKGAALGLAAGLGAVYLPKPLGLKEEPSNRTLETKLMTVGYYLAGGIVAGITAMFLEKKASK